MNGVWLIIQREWWLTMRHPADAFNPLMLVLLIVSLFPLALSPDAALLSQMGPAVIWVAALLAHLLAAERLFRDDWLDGSLEQYLLLPISFTQVVVGKLFFHWLSTSLPVIVVAPMLGLFYALKGQAVWALWLSLLLGTPVLALLSAVGASLVVSLRNRGILLILLVTPWYIPVLIFGAGSVVAVDMPMALSSSLAMLGALLAITLVLAPLAVMAALRVGITE
jgi:heme exporter protein B